MGERGKGVWGMTRGYFEGFTLIDGGFWVKWGGFVRRFGKRGG